MGIRSINLIWIDYWKMFTEQEGLTYEELFNNNKFILILTLLLSLYKNSNLDEALSLNIYFKYKMKKEYLQSCIIYPVKNENNDYFFKVSSVNSINIPINNNNYETNQIILQLLELNCHVLKNASAFEMYSSDKLTNEISENCFDIIENKLMDISIRVQMLEFIFTIEFFHKFTWPNYVVSSIKAKRVDSSHKNIKRIAKIFNEIIDFSNLDKEINKFVYNDYLLLEIIINKEMLFYGDEDDEEILKIVKKFVKYIEKVAIKENYPSLNKMLSNLCDIYATSIARKILNISRNSLAGKDEIYRDVNINIYENCLNKFFNEKDIQLCVFNIINKHTKINLYNLKNATSCKISNITIMKKILKMLFLEDNETNLVETLFTQAQSAYKGKFGIMYNTITFFNLFENLLNFYNILINDEINPNQFNKIRESDGIYYLLKDYDDVMLVNCEKIPSKLNRQSIMIELGIFQYFFELFFFLIYSCNETNVDEVKLSLIVVLKILFFFLDENSKCALIIAEEIFLDEIVGEHIDNQKNKLHNCRAFLFLFFVKLYQNINISNEKTIKIYSYLKNLVKENLLFEFGKNIDKRSKSYFCQECFHLSLLVVKSFPFIISSELEKNIFEEVNENTKKEDKLNFYCVNFIGETLIQFTSYFSQFYEDSRFPLQIEEIFLIYLKNNYEFLKNLSDNHLKNLKPFLEKFSNDLAQMNTLDICIDNLKKIRKEEFHFYYRINVYSFVKILFNFIDDKSKSKEELDKLNKETINFYFKSILKLNFSKFRNFFKEDTILNEYDNFVDELQSNNLKLEGIAEKSDSEVMENNWNYFVLRIIGNSEQFNLKFNFFVLIILNFLNEEHFKNSDLEKNLNDLQQKLQLLLSKILLKENDSDLDICKKINSVFVSGKNKNVLNKKLFNSSINQNKKNAISVFVQFIKALGKSKRVKKGTFSSIENFKYESIIDDLCQNIKNIKIVKEIVLILKEFDKNSENFDDFNFLLNILADILKYSFEEIEGYFKDVNFNKLRTTILYNTQLKQEMLYDFQNKLIKTELIELLFEWIQNMKHQYSYKSLKKLISLCNIILKIQNKEMQTKFFELFEEDEYNIALYNIKLFLKNSFQKIIELENKLIRNKVNSSKCFRIIDGKFEYFKDNLFQEYSNLLLWEDNAKFFIEILQFLKLLCENQFLNMQTFLFMQTKEGEGGRREEFTRPIHFVEYLVNSILDGYIDICAYHNMDIGYNIIYTLTEVIQGNTLENIRELVYRTKITDNINKLFQKIISVIQAISEKKEDFDFGSLIKEENLKNNSEGIPKNSNINEFEKFYLPLDLLKITFQFLNSIIENLDSDGKNFIAEKIEWIVFCVDTTKIVFNFFEYKNWFKNQNYRELERCIKNYMTDEEFKIVFITMLNLLVNLKMIRDYGIGNQKINKKLYKYLQNDNYNKASVKKTVRLFINIFFLIFFLFRIQCMKNLLTKSLNKKIMKKRKIKTDKILDFFWKELKNIL